MTWMDCWISYCQVVLAFHPSRALELLKYPDLIVRTHSIFHQAYASRDVLQPLCPPYRPFGGQWTPLARAKLEVSLPDPRSVVPPVRFSRRLQSWL